MKATKLVGMLRLETAAQRQFLRLTPRERRIYARANADSRFARAAEDTLHPGHHFLHACGGFFGTCHPMCRDVSTMQYRGPFMGRDQVRMSMDGLGYNHIATSGPSDVFQHPDQGGMTVNYAAGATAAGTEAPATPTSGSEGLSTTTGAGQTPPPAPTTNTQSDVQPGNTATPTEASEAGWFDHMSPAAKKKYMTEHPGSKFGPQGSIRTGVVTGVVNKDSARMGHVRQHNTDEHDAFGYTSATDQRHLGTFKTKDDAKRAINTHYKAGGHARAKVDPGDNAQVPFEEWQAQVHKHAIHGRPDPSELRRMYAAEHRVSPRAAAENFDDVNASKSFHDNRMYMDEDHD